MKPFFKILFLGIIILTNNTFANSSFNFNGVDYKTTSDSTIETTKNNNNGYIGSIKIADKYLSNDSAKTYIVKSIGKYSFYGSKKLLSIDMPESIDSIDNFAFTDCVGLKSIKIPKNVVKIKYCAFQGCYGITTVDIPSNVKEIGNNAFFACKNLRYVTINSMIPPKLGANAFSTIKVIGTPEIGYDNTTYMPMDITIYVPFGSIDRYKQADGWKDFFIVEMDNNNPNNSLGTSINEVVLDTYGHNNSSIYDINGRLVLNKSNINNKGVYLFVERFDNNNKTTKTIINN